MTLDPIALLAGYTHKESLNAVFKREVGKAPETTDAAIIQTAVSSSTGADLNESQNPDADHFTPNEDPEAGLLFERLCVVLDKRQDGDKAILAFDVTLMARHPSERTKPAESRDEGRSHYRRAIRRDGPASDLITSLTPFSH